MANDLEPLDKFTPRAQQALALAQAEAARLNRHFVGTEHILLGLLKLGQGVAVAVLKTLGLDLETVRLEVEKQIGTGPNQLNAIGHAPRTPRVKKVLALATEERQALNHFYLGTEHILLGLLREGDGVAARVLLNLHVSIDQTRYEILKELDPSFEHSSHPAAPQIAPDLPSDATFVQCTKEDTLNFTPRAQQALRMARKEAERFHHSFVGTEHLLLGMIKLGQGVAVNVLQKLGLDLETVRMEVEKQVGTGPDQKMIGNIPYTPRVKKVLALAAKEAKNLNHTYVGTEHILLGLLGEGDGVAARVLKNVGINIEQTRQEILEELDPNLEPSIRRETLKRSANVPSQGPAEAMSNFTPRACQVLGLARKEADRFGHNFVGPEHLLIGLIGLGQGVAANELSRLGLVLDTVRIEVQKQLGTGPDPKHVGNIPYTPAIKKVFARAAGWAQKLNHTYVGTEHILLGLLDDDGGATGVIRNLGPDPDRIRVEILRKLGPNAGS